MLLLFSFLFFFRLGKCSKKIGKDTAMYDIWTFGLDPRVDPKNFTGYPPDVVASIKRLGIRNGNRMFNLERKKFTKSEKNSLKNDPKSCPYHQLLGTNCRNKSRSFRLSVMIRTLHLSINLLHYPCFNSTIIVQDR